LRFSKAERIVPVGIISPNAIHLPGIYVDRIVQATTPKHLEPFTLAPNSASSTEAPSFRDRIAKRAAKEIKDGYSVNLGIGIPNLVSQFLEPGVKVWLQSENGMLGMGPYPVDEDRIDPYVVGPLCVSRQ
jgi:3-oxoacid CoA-transferase